jgi:hypothetical protein
MPALNAFRITPTDLFSWSLEDTHGAAFIERKRLGGKAFPSLFHAHKSMQAAGGKKLSSLLDGRIT